MKLKLKESRDFGLLVLRIGIGLMFVLVHGLPKVMGAYPRGPDLEERSIDSSGSPSFPRSGDFWPRSPNLAEACA